VGVVRTLVSTAIVGAAGSARAGAGAAELALRRGPSLLALSARATVASGKDAARAETVFRDELLTLLDDVAEIAWRQARRARLELAARTSLTRAPTPASGPGMPAASGGAPRRHARVKA
jgi:hypothetical protein